ncbi:hypothetical protein [Engelhardtia mirabilis]|uniref:Uncharacterized protein n=1 Tax=Engelhardtia mirabilis TaxID=2528011 RepID=A0A518BJ54_9BACT|nr:hypothetical protein Pla133_20750 [Planctomycetes bacterium Pla133]QDV01325.1 hypothetical protein Pla86_20750 [Planctomycetes bacterium Pla86]
MQPAASLLGLLRSSSPIVFGLGLGLVPLQADHNLTFGPTKDSSWSRSISRSSQLSGGNLEVWMNGQPVPAAFLPRLDLEFTDTIRVQCIDRYLEPGSGRPSALLRTIEQASHTGSGSMAASEGVEAQAWEYEADSPLVGDHLYFQWSEGDDEPRAQRVEGISLEPTAEEVPEGTLEDLDLRGLLPDSPVAIGAKWEAPAESLAALIWPCGNLDFEFSDEDARYQPRVRERELDGTIELTLVAVEDGLARIALRGELVETLVKQGDLSNVPIASGEATDTETSTIALEGALVWSIAAGLPVELDLTGAIDRELRTRKDDGQEGPPYESRLTFSGRLEIEMTVEDR